MNSTTGDIEFECWYLNTSWNFESNMHHYATMHFDKNLEEQDSTQW